MLRADQTFVDAVEAAVGRVEDTTDAELVVVVAARSSRWMARRYAVGTVLAFAVLAFAVYGPTAVPAFWLPVDVLLAFALAAWLPGRFPRLLRPLLFAEERTMVAVRAAHAAFHEEEVHSTRARTGVLVYVSVLEERVVVLPDNGVTEFCPPGLLERSWDLSSVESVVEGLEALGVPLAEHLPPTHDNPDELPNRPRVRA